LVAFIAAIISLVAIMCYPHLGRTVPVNYVLLLIFTLSESYMVSITTAFYPPKSVLVATLLTLGITLLLTLFAFTTDKDFTSVYFAFFSLIGLVCMSLFIFIFISIPYMHLLFAILWAIIYCVYIVADTLMIIGSKAYKFEIDDYIFAALNLYVDIIGLFLELLRIFGSSR
jgi:protein lifeguard